MADSVLTAPERAPLEALNTLGVRYVVVGMSAALLQGARGATEDIDLWFEHLDDPRIGQAARQAGAFWVLGAFGMRPPAFGGEALGDRFDVITHMHGLRSFPEEFAEALAEQVDGVRLRILPLRRIVVSKKAAGRPKDHAQIPALEEALAVLEANTSR